MADDVLRLVWDGTVSVNVMLETHKARTSALCSDEESGLPLAVWCRLPRRLPVGIAVDEALRSVGLALEDVAGGPVLAVSGGATVLPEGVPVGAALDMLKARAGDASEDDPDAGAPCLRVALRDADAVPAPGSTLGPSSLLGPGRSRLAFQHRLKRSCVSLLDSAGPVVEASSAALDAMFGTLRAGTRGDAEALTCALSGVQAASREAPDDGSGGGGMQAVPVAVLVVPASPGPGGDGAWYHWCSPRVGWADGAGSTAASLAAACAPAAAGRPVWCDGVEVTELGVRDAWQRLAAPDGCLYLVVGVLAAE